MLAMAPDEASLRDARMQELLAEGDFVRALARQLLGEHDGDDVAQDAWAKALARGGATVRSPRAWLARVVHRLASNRRRADRRRLARERDAVAAASAGHAPSTDDILACEQVRQRVVAAVLALDEPFRGTVLARFYECLGTAAIAARDRVPEATVRSRLKRGLDRLRARLDADHSTRAAWAAPLALLGGEPVPIALPAGVATATSKKAPAALAAVMLLGLTAWASGVLSPASPPPAPSQRDEATAGAAATPRDRDGGDVLRTATAAANALDPGEPRERVPYPLASEPIDDVPVRVLDRETRAPVADAQVLFAPFRVDFLHPATRGDQRLHEMASSETFLDRFGTRVRTNAVGEATVRVPRSGGSVVATRGDLRRRADLRPERVLPGERVAVWLERVREVRLRCVDEATGAPLEGVLIDASWSSPEAVVARAEGGGGMFGPSGADGVVGIPLTAAQHSLRVRPWTLTTRSMQPIELPAALERVTHVRCAPTGSMTIELRTPSGALWPSPIDGGISCQNPSLHSNIAGPITWCRAERGTYRVPHVALGLTWKASVCEDPLQGVWHSAIAAGPRQPGEDVRVVVTTPREPCVAWASLRLAAGGGPPPPGRWLVFQGTVDREQICASGINEPDGRIGWPVSPAAPPAGRIEVLGGDSCPIGGCAWRLDAATSGAHELGELVLDAPTLIAGGRIEIAGAGPMPPLRVAVEVPSGDGWRPWRSVAVGAAAACTFAVRGTVRASRARVSVLPDACCLPSEPIVADLGARDLRFRVERGHALRARVLAPAELAQAVRVRVVRADGSTLPPVAAEATWDEPRPRGDGALVDFDGTASTFAWPALPAGSYRVDVLAPGVERPIATIDGVRVGDGAPPDSRLDPIDLRERVRTLAVALVPLPSGPRPVTDAGVLAFASGAPGDPVEGMLFDARGEARLAVGADPVDVIVAVPGFRVWRAQNVTASSLQVQLEPPIAVPFRLAPHVAERLAGRRVHVELDPVRPGDESFAICFRRPGEREPAMQTALHCLQRLADGGRGTLDDTRAAGTIPVTATGRFAVRLAIDTPTGRVHVNESWKHWQGSPLVPAQVTVGDGAIPELVVDVEEPILAKVAEELSRGR
jgi:RNA polymerase sigma factor (sigma-70 family)